MRGSEFPAVSHSVLVFMCLLTTMLGSAQGQNLSAESPDTYRQLLDRYCIGCHNDRARIGELSLEAIDLDNVGHEASDVAVWERVIRKLRARSMPPVGRPRPTTTPTTSSLLGSKPMWMLLPHNRPIRGGDRPSTG